MNVMNTVSTILPVFTDQKIALLFHGLCIFLLWGGCGTGRLRLWILHSATCKDEGVIAHVRGSKGFSRQVHDHFTKLIVKRRD